MSADPSVQASESAGRQRRRRIVELILMLSVAAFLALTFQAFALKPFRIPSGSMEPTLHIGDRVLADRFSHRVLGAVPHVGDIVVFHPPAGADEQPARCGNPVQDSDAPCDRATPTRSSQNFIKRVVGVGGDRIAVRDGHVIRNGKLQQEPFAVSCQPGNGCYFARSITVPRGSFYLMGDNRGNSDDSRFWGPVPRKWIVGKAVLTYWPPGRIDSH